MCTSVFVASIVVFLGIRRALNYFRPFQGNFRVLDDREEQEGERNETGREHESDTSARSDGMQRPSLHVPPDHSTESGQTASASGTHVTRRVPDLSLASLFPPPTPLPSPILRRSGQGQIVRSIFDSVDHDDEFSSADLAARAAAVAALNPSRETGAIPKAGTLSQPSQITASESQRQTENPTEVSPLRRVSLSSHPEDDADLSTPLFNRDETDDDLATPSRMIYKVKRILAETKSKLRNFEKKENK